MKETVHSSRANRDAPPGMRLVERGKFTMGSVQWYPEEAPLREVRVDSFWIDETPVTNRQFAKFVEWKDIALEDDDTIIQMFPVSSLPSHPDRR